MKTTVLIVDDEAGVRSALSGVLRDEGYVVDAVESGEACLDRVVRAAVRRHRPRHLAAWYGRAGDAGAPARASRRCSGRHDFRPRQYRVGGEGDQARRVRLRRKAPLAREDRARDRQCGAPEPPRGREPRFARARRSALDDGRGELRDGAAARAGGDGCAHQRSRAHLRRERDREGAGRAHRFMASAGAAAGRLSRSTARRFPKS